MEKTKYIKIPAPIALKDPASGQVIPGAQEFAFKMFIIPLMNHPALMETYLKVHMANSIMKELENPTVMGLSEDEYFLFKRIVCDEPKTLINGTLQSGYGLLPSLMPQVLPYLEAIINPTDSPPIALAA